MSVSWRSLVLCHFTALSALACQESEPHPPLADPCAPGEGCSLGVGQVGGPSSTGGSTAGGNGAGGSAGANAGVVSGTVVDLIDDTFVSSIPFGNPAIVEAQSSSGSLISASWNGNDPFQLAGIEPSTTAWVSVRPTVGTGSLRTLHPIATNIARTVDLGLVRADTIDAIFSILTVPSQRAASTAQAVLVFTKTSGASVNGVAGVKATLGDAAFTAYANGAVWSSDVAGTSSSGLAVVGNIPATAFPGSSKRIFLSGTGSGFIDIRVVADAVSLVGVPL
ncbi:MAG TPA: hypothetical protein VG937_21070 [Polyangiaceae bacterium]|nr:hypothetical protein [Polyangiaceae bacterium]